MKTHHQIINWALEIQQLRNAHETTTREHIRVGIIAETLLQKLRRQADELHRQEAALAKALGGA